MKKRSYLRTVKLASVYRNSSDSKPKRDCGVNTDINHFDIISSTSTEGTKQKKSRQVRVHFWINCLTQIIPQLYILIYRA